jgi:hypothetical protein
MDRPLPPLAFLTACLLLLSPSSPVYASALPSATPTTLPSVPVHTAPSSSKGIHLPLLRRNGHLSQLSHLQKREHKQDVVKAWALREMDRVGAKYGDSSAAKRLRRRKEETWAEDEETSSEGDEDDEKPSSRRRQRNADPAPTSEEDPLFRRQIAVAPPTSSSSIASSSSSSTRTALSVAGYGTSSASSNQSYGLTTLSGTRTGTGSAARATQTRPVGEVLTLNWEADLCVLLPS